MVDGLTPHIVYFPVAALAALTAALVTLIVAVNAWRRSSKTGQPLQRLPDNRVQAQSDQLTPRSLKKRRNRPSYHEDSVDDITKDILLTEIPSDSSWNDRQDRHWSDSGSDGRRSPWMQNEISNNCPRGESEILTAYMNRLQSDRESISHRSTPNKIFHRSSERDYRAAKYRTMDSFFNSKNVKDDLKMSRSLSSILCNLKHVPCSDESGLLRCNSACDGIFRRSKQAHRSEPIFKSKSSPIFDVVSRSKRNLGHSYIVNEANLEFCQFRSDIPSGENYFTEKTEILSVVIDDENRNCSNLRIVLKEHDDVNEESRASNTDPELSIQLKNAISKDNVGSDLEIKATPDRDSLPEQSDAIASLLESPSDVTQKSCFNNSQIYAEKSLKYVKRVRTFSENTSDIELNESSICSSGKYNNLSRSLDSVFFLYEISGENRLRVINDDSLLSRIDICAVTESMSRTTDKSTVVIDVDVSSKRMDCLHKSKADICSKQLIPVKFEPVNFRPPNLNTETKSTGDSTSSKKVDCEKETESTATEKKCIGVFVGTAEGDERLVDCLQRQYLETSSEGNAEEEKNPLSVPVGEVAGDKVDFFAAKFCRCRAPSKEDNEGLYSCFPSCDVTSSLHAGKRVQGSRRGELIGEACSKSHIVTEKQSQGVFQSPAYDGRKMQMAGAITSRCDGHDLDTKREASDHAADRLGRLDELLHNLRAIADDTPSTNAENQRGTSGVLHPRSSGDKGRKLSIGLLSDYYNDKRTDSAFIPPDYSSSEYSNYASDDSQSICLSSLDGDSNFSSCINSSLDSPKSVRKQLEAILQSESSNIDNNCSSEIQEIYNKQEEYSISPSVNTADEIKRYEDNIVNSSSDILECAIKQLTDSLESLSAERVKNNMEDSPGNIRLRNLLERDKQRQEHRKLALTSGEKHSTVSNEEGKCTLKAMETAIGHMQHLIQQGRRIEQCHSDDHELHNKQYFTIHERKTIDSLNNTEVRRYKLISFDSGVGSEEITSNEGTPLGEYKKSLNLEEIATGSNRKENPTQDNDFSVDTLPDRECVTSDCEERWRYEREFFSPCETDEKKSNFDRQDVPSKNNSGVMKSLDLIRSVDNRISQPVYYSANGSGKTELETEAESCLLRSAENDVTENRGQWESFPSREGRADREAAASRPPFSDVLRIREELGMESGGCETDKVTSPPPPAQTANAATNTAPTPTKVKNLRFKLDPDIFDLPAENGYYPEDDEDYNRRPGWRKQPKYQTFSSLQLGGSREPVKVVSVRTSVVPAGTKMVVKPVCVSEGQPSIMKGRNSGDPKVTVKSLDIDLRIRLETQESENKTGKRIEPIVDVVRGDWRASPDRQIKRTHLSNSPAEIKKRSPIPDFSGWNQSLSPVSENCDWVAVPSTSAEEAVLSTSSDPGQEKVFPFNNSAKFSSFNDFTVGTQSGGSDAIPFKENGDDHFSETDAQVDNNTNFLMTSTPARPATLELNHFRKYLQLPRKKFVPDPDAVERITGFKAAEESASTKPPLPPSIRSLPNSHRMSSGAKNRIDQLRKKYLDSKALMAAQKVDSSAKFEQFLNSAQEDRAKIANSAPDLAAFEAAVRNQWSKVRNESNVSSASKENSPPMDNLSTTSSVRSNTPDDAWMNYVQLLRRQLNRRSQSMTYLETDVDAFFNEDKCQSMTTLEDSPPNSTQSLFLPTTPSKRISMHLEASDRTKSEHELRVEKSLQNLSVPEWYKHSQRPKVGFILDKKSNEKRGWAAVKSLTSSTTSLASAGTKPRRPARSLRTSHENLLWSRGSASPASTDISIGRYTKSATTAPVLSLALAKAFREPYVGWRARTPSSCTSASPQVDFSPPSWVAMDNTERSDTPLTSDLQAMDEEDDTGLSFDGEDVIEVPGSSDMQDPPKVNNRDSPLPSADDTCDDIINISMDTCDHPFENHENSKSGDLPGEDTCDDIKNITMDTFELFPPNPNEEHKTSPIGDDTCDDILNISTDTSSRLNPPVNGNQCTSSIMGATEDTGVDIDDISTDTSNLPLSQPLANGKRESNSEDRKLTNGDRHNDDSLCSNLNETDPSLDSNIIHDSINRISSVSHRVNGNGNSQIVEDELINDNHQVIFTMENERRTNGNTLYHFDRSHEIEKNRLDPKKKRYSYNRSIYHSEFDGVKNRIAVSHKNHLDGSTQSLPGDKNSRDDDRVIWIESSFVGSRTTTSIVVMPTEDASKDACKGSTGSNTSVGRPASR